MDESFLHTHTHGLNNHIFTYEHIHTWTINNKILTHEHTHMDSTIKYSHEHTHMDTQLSNARMSAHTQKLTYAHTHTWTLPNAQKYVRTSIDTEHSNANICACTHTHMDTFKCSDMRTHTRLNIQILTYAHAGTNGYTHTYTQASKLALHPSFEPDTYM